MFATIYKPQFRPLASIAAIHGSTALSLDFHGEYAAGSGLILFSGNCFISVIIFTTLCKLAQPHHYVEI